MNALAGFATGFADGVEDRRMRELAAAEARGAAPSTGNPGMDPGISLGAAPPSRPWDGPAGTLQFWIDRTEGAGDYSTLYGHAQNDPSSPFHGVDVSNMTLAELYEFSNPSGAYGNWVKDKVGHIATPMGRHQIVGKTMRATAEAMGLSPDTVFNAATQDKMRDYLINQRLSGADTMAAKLQGLRNEWAGLRNVSDNDLIRAISMMEEERLAAAAQPLGAGRPM